MRGVSGKRMGWAGIVPALTTLVALLAPAGATAQSPGTVAGNCPEPAQIPNRQLNDLGRDRYDGQVFTSQLSGPATHAQATFRKYATGQQFVAVLQSVDASGNPAAVLGYGSIDDAVVPKGDSSPTFPLDGDGNDPYPQLVKGQRYALSVTQVGVPFDPTGESYASVFSTSVGLCGPDVPGNGFFISSPNPAGGSPVGPYEFPFPGVSMIFGVFSEPTCQGKLATILGTPDGDKLVGTKGRDVILAYGGRDLVLGKGGRDVLCGGGGKDLLQGQAARDVLVGGSGADKCAGGSGDDSVGCEGSLGESITGESCQGTLINSTSHSLVVTARSKNPKDSWGHEVDVGQEIPANGAEAEWRTDAPNFRGCKNSITFAVSDDGGRTVLGTITTKLEKDWTIGFKGGFSCNSTSPRFSCSQVSADKDSQGFQLSVVWNAGGG